MATPSSDRDLLAGFLALKLNLISREQLVQAVDEWLGDKSRSIAKILRTQGALNEADQQMLEPVLAGHLESQEDGVAGDPMPPSAPSAIMEHVSSDGDSESTATVSMAMDRSHDTSVEPTLSYSPVNAMDGVAHLSGHCRFQVLRPHARGGLGEVFLAKDLELNREVALKEIQSRLADDPSSRTRFLVEAEITGGLEHPGIVPVYGLGRYADGRPYYAMRFIKGDSLQEAADRFHGRVKDGQQEHKIDFSGVEFRKLLGRFIDVCQAIEYAHSRGVLHRDLKPGNIMLGKYGETLVVDWGLAKTNVVKAVASEFGESALQLSSTSGDEETVFGTAIGTPAYMPPEQAAGRIDLLGPLSDVYSLGATLYYLLTGTSPCKGKNGPEILENVQTGSFSRPHEVQPQVPKALEAICLKAMSLAPPDRYVSPVQIADDVERFLADEPVSALTDPLSVRARRWMRKHPKLVASLAATLLVGLSSTIMITVVVAGKNRELADKNEALDEANREVTANAALEAANAAEQVAKDDAIARQKETQSVLEFFQNHILAAARPRGQQGGLGVDTTIRQAVDSVEPLISVLFNDQPLVEAAIRNTMGLSYLYLRENPQAITQFTRSRELRASTLGDDHSDTLSSMNNLAGAYHHAGRLDLAIPLYEETLRLRKSKAGEGYAETLESVNNLATAYLAAGHSELALPLLESVTQQLTASSGDNSPETLLSLNNLASVYLDQGMFERAIALDEQVLQRMKLELGEQHPDTLMSMGNLATAYQKFGKTDRALPLLEETLRLKKISLGAVHQETLLSMHNVAAAYEALGQNDRAMALFEETFRLENDTLGESHPNTLQTMNSLALAYQEAGQIEKAVSLYEETLRLRKSSLGEDHPETISTMDALAAAYYSASRLDLALPRFEETFDKAKTVLGEEHAVTIHCMGNLAMAYQQAGRFDLAMPLHEEALRLKKEKLGDEHPETLASMNNLAMAHLSQGKTDLALPLTAELLRLTTAKLGSEHPDTLLAMNNLGGVYYEMGQPNRALPVMEETLRLRAKVLGEVHPLTLATIKNLAVAYQSVGQFERSIELLEATLTRMQEKYGDDYPETLTLRGMLGSAYCGANQGQEGAAMFQEYLAKLRLKFPKGHPQFASVLAQAAMELTKCRQHSAAEEYLRECLVIRQETQPNAWSTFSTQSSLGGTLLDQTRQLLESDRDAANAKMIEVEALLVEGYKGMKRRLLFIPDAEKIRVTEALERLVDFYTVTDKQEEASKWQAELDAWTQSFEGPEPTTSEDTPQELGDKQESGNGM